MFEWPYPWDSSVRIHGPELWEQAARTKHNEHSALTPRTWAGCLFKSHPEACILVTQYNPSLGDVSGEAGWPSISLSLGLLARQIRGSRRPLNSQKWQDPYSNQGSVVQNANYSYGASPLSGRVKTLRMNRANPNLDGNWGNSAFTGDGTRIHSGFREDGRHRLWVRREWFVTIHLLKPSLRASSQESEVCSLYFHVSYVIHDNKIK